MDTLNDKEILKSLKKVYEEAFKIAYQEETQECKKHGGKGKLIYDYKFFYGFDGEFYKIHIPFEKKCGERIEIKKLSSSLEDWVNKDEIMELGFKEWAKKKFDDYIHEIKDTTSAGSSIVVAARISRFLYGNENNFNLVEFLKKEGIYEKLREKNLKLKKYKSIRSLISDIKKEWGEVTNRAEIKIDNNTYVSLSTNWKSKFYLSQDIYPIQESDEQIDRKVVLFFLHIIFNTLGFKTDTFSWRIYFI